MRKVRHMRAVLFLYMGSGDLHWVCLREGLLHCQNMTMERVFFLYRCRAAGGLRFRIWKG